MDFTIFFSILLYGLFHGLEPGHGWPLAFLYSVKKERKIKSAFITSTILALSHMVSSIAVVIAYLIFSAFITIPIEILRVVGFTLLVLMAILFWRESVEGDLASQHEHLHGNKKTLEHEHSHQHLDGNQHTHVHNHARSTILTLSGLTTYALILGFAHEEEFALIGLIISGVDPWFLIITYAAAVSGALIGITVACTKAYGYFLPRLQRFQKYLPKISAIIMLIMAVLFLFNVL